MPWLTNLLGGIWFRLAAGAIGAVLIFSAGAYADHRWNESKIADLRAEHAQEAADNATAALQRLAKQMDGMQKASADYGATRDQLFTRLDTLNKEFHNAIKPAPLPPDCMPDAARVRALAEAVTATNAAADPGATIGFGETVRTPPASN